MTKLKYIDLEHVQKFNTKKHKILPKIEYGEERKWKMERMKM